MESKSPAVLNTIKDRAISLWGEENWLREIVKEYVRLEKEQDPTTSATTNSRRSQILRAFETGGCRLETAMLLAEAVGCQFQMVCTEVQVSKF